MISRVLSATTAWSLGLALSLPCFAQEPPITVTAEWASPACRVPAKFRITLTNSGESAFWVPKRDSLGRGRTVNLVSFRNGQEATTEDYFGPPPLTLHPQVQFFLELAPGASHSFDVEFDGTFAPHGYPVRGPSDWDSNIRFEYTLAPPSDFGAESTFGPIRGRDAARPVRSNTLACE